MSVNCLAVDGTKGMTQSSDISHLPQPCLLSVFSVT